MNLVYRSLSSAGALRDAPAGILFARLRKLLITANSVLVIDANCMHVQCWNKWKPTGITCTARLNLLPALEACPYSGLEVLHRSQIYNICHGHPVCAVFYIQTATEHSGMLHLIHGKIVG